MAGQEQQRQQRRSGEQEVDEVEVPTSTTEAPATSDVDSLLDEIDDVLETNSEEFVRGFVQKGGQ
ncbi:ubiquitin-like protein Pup [Aquipuribacter sp. SD81]|uniref:ubiquitin-like protein Pup n=1 Tax=Aquipuribacter sp. SD81 TaxID=3127703 RepID=UPI003018D3B1